MGLFDKFKNVFKKEEKKDIEVYEKAKKTKILNKHLEIEVPDSIFDELEKINNDNKAIIEKEKRKSKTNGWIAGGSGILNLILILLLCL